MIDKGLIIGSLAVIGFATTAVAGEVNRVKVYDHTKIVVTSVPVTETRCKRVKRPIYEDVTTQGNAAEGALLGMILGGLAGKGATGKDDGAAAGAVIGGLIGADRGGKPKTESRIVGYTDQEQCEDVTVYADQRREVYSHSTIRFYVDGERYVLEFQK